MIAAPAAPLSGWGYLLATNYHGTVVITGATADGAAFSQSSAISTNGDVALYASLYGGSGCVLGWIHLTTNPSGSLSWIKKPVNSGRYPAGFRNLTPFPARFAVDRANARRLGNRFACGNAGAVRTKPSRAAAFQHRPFGRKQVGQVARQSN